ncbi:hypothetical protein FB451DRAFT_1239394 [Mycena latifolia]|nr:hypothetical protein FB451DRAFT_1239394 [Mycena latifolia]
MALAPSSPLPTLISGGTFNQVAGDLNQYHIAGDFNQSAPGRDGIDILRRYIMVDAFHDSERRVPPPRCYPNTRTAALEILQHWAESASESVPIMWLHGPAGAGKSAIAQTMAERWSFEEKLGAAFFFGRNIRGGGAEGHHLFPTIAYQLTTNIPHLRAPIGEVVQADSTIPERTLELQCQALIINPAKTLPPAGSSHIVLIDGLDECPGNTTQSRIMHLILEAIRTHRVPFKFLVCSRPEPHLRVVVDTLHPHSHILHRLALDEDLDIYTYFRASFTDIYNRRYPEAPAECEWPSELELEKLVHSASGQFIYAATVLNYADDEYSLPEERLASVLEIRPSDSTVFADLDALYLQILSSNPNSNLIVRILGAYFIIPDPKDARWHSPRFFEAILDLSPGTVRLALRGLHSLLLIPSSDDDGILVHHQSLVDFLLDARRAGRFYLDAAVHHASLASRCLSVVSRCAECTIGFSRFLMHYSHIYWPKHITPSGLHSVRSYSEEELHKCLLCLRAALQPEKLALRNDDHLGLTILFHGIIDFLIAFEDIQVHHADDSNLHSEIWTLLLISFFEPDSPIASYLDSWGPSVRNTESNSVLGHVLQRIWGNRTSVKRVTSFLAESASDAIRQRSAYYSLRLLMHSSTNTRTWDRRYNASWVSAGHWCHQVVLSPNSQDVLGALERVMRAGFLWNSGDTSRRSFTDLVTWLEKFEDPPRNLIAIFAAIQEVEGTNSPWFLINYSGVTAV